MRDMRTVKQSINVCHPRQDLRDESHLLSLERSNSISRVGSIVNPKYRFFRKIPHICAAHSVNHFSDDMCVRKNTSQAASVEFTRLQRANYARSGLQRSHSKKRPFRPLF